MLCRVCNIDKPLTEYYFRGGSKTKYMTLCKNCHNKRCAESKLSIINEDKPFSKKEFVLLGQSKHWGKRS